MWFFCFSARTCSLSSVVAPTRCLRRRLVGTRTITADEGAMADPTLCGRGEASSIGGRQPPRRVAHQHHLQEASRQVRTSSSSYALLPSHFSYRFLAGEFSNLSLPLARRLIGIIFTSSTNFKEYSVFTLSQCSCSGARWRFHSRVAGEAAEQEADPPNHASAAGGEVPASDRECWC